MFSKFHDKSGESGKNRESGGNTSNRETKDFEIGRSAMSVLVLYLQFCQFLYEL